MGISEFRARNGLLESLTRRHNIKFLMISDEAAAVEPSERLTILFAANAAGERLVPLVIVEAAYPRAFRHARVNVPKLSVTWKYNKSAWMTAEVFAEWLEVVNAAMRQQHCEILLLVDNAPSHLNVELSNVKLEFFPAKSTSCLQPMDLGVIRQFKCKYCLRLFQSHKKVASGHIVD
ncbi:Tigger transposable element-derived protein 1 [Trichinella nelsoni]|uniref:Tigger transposable element-derived protein 1 n=1 Tax=Trichinella nelsoni TaxID=6336 RepID=A0A0V0SLC0_9BILA|nr:Tigger transposable element-derived protein 1 [Trichinella nelsoni]